ncbi:hypothetical protein JCM3765_001275 [Sporobolomyces pararoseus]
MLTRRLTTTLLQSSRISSSQSIRFASSSSVSTSDLPRAKPHEKIPFSAPPKDETKGDLGQVHLPSMVENVQELPMKIPSEPDAYQISSSSQETSPSSTSSSSEDPSSSSSSSSSTSTPKLHTVSSPSTYPKEGRPILVGESADDTFEGFEGDHKLPASAVNSKQTSSSSSEKDSSSSSSGGKGEGEGEPLNQEDRIGLFKLGGILVGGWILSGLTRPYKPQHPEKEGN